MKTLWTASGWAAAALLAFLAAFGASSSDALHRWDDLLVEKYSQWSQREVPSDIVVIGIDSRSLAELNSWPWPRRHHARVLDFLRDASARHAFVDIDFSSSSNAQDDALLAAAFARWNRQQVILPLFLQATSGSEARLSLTEPLPAFAKSATLASVNLVPDKDAIVRRAESSWSIRNGTAPAVFVALAGGSHTGEAMPIDFSISPGSFGYYSYVDILQGRVPLEELRGKTVLIGATALELGDMQPVPVHRSLPGVVIHALATQTAISGPVKPVSTVVSLTLLVAWTALLAWLMRHSRWSVNLAITTGATVAALGIGLAAFALRMRFDVMPLVVAASGNFIGVTIASLDAARLRSAILARLARRRQILFDSVLESSYDAILCVDQSGAIVSANIAAQSMLDSHVDQLRSRNISAFLPDIGAIGGPGELAAMNGRILERTIHLGDDRSIPVEISTTVAEHDEGRHFTLILRDLRERKKQEAALLHQATHDSLTGLLNRLALFEEVDRLAKNPDTRAMAVLSLNLSRFKAVNDTLGHAAGDAMLCYAAWRLSAVMEGHGALARMDGDGFAILARCDGNREHLLQLVHSLGESLRRPFDFEGIPIGVGLTVGIACFPKDGTDAVTLIKNAGIAVQRAKTFSEDFSFYDPDADQHSVRRLALLGELQAAIDSDSLELHYQPKVALRTGKVDNVEALLRWSHPVHGSVSPAEMIPLIEPTEMLRPLTDWTIRRALEQNCAWAKQGLHVGIAVNLSARLLQDFAFPDRLAALLAAHDVMPCMLELEITESAMLMDVGRALHVGRRIRELGVSLSIDDYGTGFSSLSYLRDLSVSALKLDRTFVDDLENSPGNRFIVESTLKLAHALNLVAVAEGVSTQWQTDYLRNLGYDFGQGYFFSRPLDAAACLQWIMARNGQKGDVRAHEIASGSESAMRSGSALTR
ncbi:MAG: EAL domain-containing protein [Gammaproteobacteria bacterium]|nr:EAL domain-containing protein [Gammaproteobacteria bacterium]